MDRSGVCRICGKERHRGKECTGVSYCLICAEAKNSDANHVVGSAKCRTFRDQLAKIKIKKMRILQVNLDTGREAQDFLMQLASEKDMDLFLICEQYQKLETVMWYQDQTAKSAIMVRNRSLRVGSVCEGSSGFTWIEVEGLRIYSYYFSPNAPYDTFLKDLDELENNMRTVKLKLLVFQQQIT